MTSIVDHIDEAFEGPAWHGPTLLSSVRGLTAEQAAWRPAPKRHNIWEIVVHAAYWKYVVRRRLAAQTGEDTGRFAVRGTNWFVRPAAGRTWAADMALLRDQHARLRETVRRVCPRGLTRIVAHGRDTAAYTIRGIAAHDVYHAGQIQLLKRLRKAG